MNKPIPLLSSHRICIASDDFYPQTSRRVKAKGTTLIELSVTIAIVAILSAMAVPAFKNMASSNRVTAYTNEFLGSLKLARNEAAMRGQRVVVCKSCDSATCTTTAICLTTKTSNWEQGWIIFIDVDNDAKVGSEDTILRVHGPLSGKITLKGNNPVKNYISYSSDGRACYANSNAFQAGTLSVCDQGTSSTNANDLKSGRISAIVISSVGRARTDKTEAECP